MGYRKLGRKSAQRKALLRDLTSDLIINEQIHTTVARAKEVSSIADKMVTLGKHGDLHARRQAAAFVRNELALVSETEEEIVVQSVLQKLFDDLASRFEDRNGGYTRVLKTGPRKGDGAPMAILEFVVRASAEDEEETEESSEEE